jgi:hypothetical protein
MTFVLCFVIFVLRRFVILQDDTNYKKKAVKVTFVLS